MKVDTNFVSHHSREMKNLTISVDPEVARWARIQAARSEKSVSRLVGDLLRAHMLDELRAETALSEYLSRGPVRFSGPYPSREASHER